jgi:hypothetical protein
MLSLLALTTASCGGSGDSKSSTNTGGTGGSGSAGNTGTGGTGGSGSAGTTSTGGTDGSGSAGTTGTAACPAFTACGGTIVPGTYKITATCMDNLVLPADSMDWCTGATGSVTATTFGGTFTFLAGNRYTLEETVSIIEKMVLPASCMNSGGTAITCSQLEAGIKQSAAADTSSDMKLSSATCTGSSGCTCSMAISGGHNESGSYVVSGNTVTSTPDGEAADDPNEFCVSGSEIRVAMPSQSGSLYIVLTRQ